MQRALIQYRNPKNYQLVMEALRMADRMDLVGFDKHCLIRPRQEKKYQGKPDYKRQEQKKPAAKKQKSNPKRTPEKDENEKTASERSE